MQVSNPALMQAFLTIATNDNISDDKNISVNQSFEPIVVDGKAPEPAQSRGVFLQALEMLGTMKSSSVQEKVFNDWGQKFENGAQLTKGELKEVLNKYDISKETLNQFVNEKTLDKSYNYDLGNKMEESSKAVEDKVDHSDDSLKAQLAGRLADWSNCGNASQKLIDRLNDTVPESVVDKPTKHLSGSKDSQKLYNMINQDVQERTFIRLSIAGIHDVTIELEPGSDKCTVFQGYQGQYSAMWWADETQEQSPFTDLGNSNDPELEQMKEHYGKSQLVDKSEVATLFKNFMDVDSFENGEEAIEAWKKLPVAPNADDILMKTGAKGDGSNLKGDTAVRIDVTERTVSKENEQQLRHEFGDRMGTAPLSSLVMSREFMQIESLSNNVKKEEAAERALKTLESLKEELSNVDIDSLDDDEKLIYEAKIEGAHNTAYGEPFDDSEVEPQWAAEAAGMMLKDFVKNYEAH
ncbi:hypothetical protein [Pleionea sp. CnH1-48]|uniref:hypothetical protein n=1 Tax=Pleionea sp. CnH1-48 TaxID=2954494 RepID=UPI0020986632|nr:hypothetical protein [Pleionea sp. CnH1-48]MCO7223163.1 hypothetical protein [Pleionea sp. CnH1-48]